jgi:hypothetical protein
MSSERRRRLAVRACPGCEQDTLVSNGAFWACGGCRYAVTSTALAMDRMQLNQSMDPSGKSPARPRNRGRFSEDIPHGEPAYTAP